MKRYVTTITFIHLDFLISCDSGYSKFNNKNLRDVWVFRSVWNEKPRMASAAIKEINRLSNDLQFPAT